MTRLDHLSIRQSEDAFVDELFARAPHLGAPLIRAHFPRAYLDVNREPWELDPTMFVEPLSERFNTTSPRVAAGLGTLARVVAENKPIYRDRLTLDDARMRIEGIYQPYHATLQRLLTEAFGAFGVAVLIDCHSMPRLSRSPATGIGPDVVLGDRYGTTCCADPRRPRRNGVSPAPACGSRATAPMPEASAPAPTAGRSMACTRCRSN